MRMGDRKPFQSTLPARGATTCSCLRARIPAISIHAPRTGSDAAKEALVRAATISIHAPRTGSDAICKPHVICLLTFQSTLPARGATLERKNVKQSCEISIHAPRTGSDWILHDVRTRFPISIHAPRTGSDPKRKHPRSLSLRNFNPRSPHGERPWSGRTLSNHARFQSTLPARGATGFFMTCAPASRFQSTLPARGATQNGNTHGL